MEAISGLSLRVFHARCDARNKLKMRVFCSEFMEGMSLGVGGGECY